MIPVRINLAALFNRKEMKIKAAGMKRRAERNYYSVLSGRISPPGRILFAKYKRVVRMNIKNSFYPLVRRDRLLANHPGKILLERGNHMITRRKFYILF